MFEQHVPGVPWAIPGQSSTNRGVALDLSLTSRFGDGGYRAFGAHYEELADTNRIVMSVQTIASQIFAVLIDTLTVYLAPVYPGDKQLGVVYHLCKGGEDRAPPPSLQGLRILNLRTASNNSSSLGWLPPKASKPERAQWAARKLRTLRPQIMTQLACTPIRRRRRFGPRPAHPRRRNY